MADYRSILNRAISALPNNTEETRRAIYDKARNALMRQLSSLEPALSPAEISKQRLQLEEAVRETENQFNDEGMLEDAVTEAVSPPPAPMLNHEPNPPAPDMPAPADKPAAPPVVTPPISATSSTPEVTAPPVNVPKPAAPSVEAPLMPPEPRISTPAPDPQNPVAATPTLPPAAPPVMPPVVPPLAKNEAARQADEDFIPTAPEVMPIKVDAPDMAVGAAPPVVVPAASQKIIHEADAAIARVDALRAERNDPLSELKETMAEDGVELGKAPDFTISKQDREGFEADERGSAPSLDVDVDSAALAVAKREKSGGRGLIWVLILLILSGIGAFSWAQRDALGPIFSPTIAKIQTTLSELLASAGSQDGAGESGQSTGNAGSPSPLGTAKKSEDRILDTPLETPKTEAETAPEQRTPLPGAATPAPEAPQAEAAQPPASPPADAPPSAQTATETVTQTDTQAGTAPAATPDAGTAATTPPVNIFNANAILYEERTDAGRPDVSTGNIVWEMVPNGSEAIGSKGLPSVRGTARIQNRDLKVRVEIMRNLDQSLPASHLIELEFEPGPLFSDDTVNNIAGVLMKQREQDNGQQLAGAVVKVSETVFWIAMSARAADLASNVDSIKGRQWFDIPIVFKSGKRAILTLEKGASGQRAIEQAFVEWEK